jgi:hypothetical protein
MSSGGRKEPHSEMSLLLLFYSNTIRARGDFTPRDLLTFVAICAGVYIIAKLWPVKPKD